MDRPIATPPLSLALALLAMAPGCSDEDPSPPIPARPSVESSEAAGPGRDARLGAHPTGVDGSALNLGFEDGTYRGWTVEGTAFGEKPVHGDAVARRDGDEASCHAGEFWAGSFERSQSDEKKGVLLSSRFRVNHRWASFLIAGGEGQKTRVELIKYPRGEVVFAAQGRNSDALERVVADLQSLHEERAELRIRIVDESSEEWGRIAFDDFRTHATKPIVPPSRLRSSPVLGNLVPNPHTAEGTAEDGIWVPEGFRVDRIAAAADITQPIAFTIDPRGRLWIVEAHSYPERQPEGEGKDRVVILADENGDGEFESHKVFADGLNLISGIEIGHGGVWLGSAPELLFIADRDRDDHPDGEPVVLLDGFGLKDTHETLNSFTWGPDGWLYGVQGVFNVSHVGKPGAERDARIEMRAGVWRYHPTRHEFEVFAHGGSNQWGLDFDETGQLFMTHCRSFWGGGPTTYVVRNGHYWNQANANYPDFVSNPGRQKNSRLESTVLRNCLPSSAAYGHGEGGAGEAGSRRIYGGHSHVGTMIYLGDNWPDVYRNQLFTFNLHGHQVNRQTNRPKGSGWDTVHAGTDHLYVADPQFVGIDLKYGPDGAVYFIDWQDKRHCHSPEADRWDRTNGRVYRMAWAPTYRPKKVALHDVADADLARFQTHHNEWFARTARRILRERRSAGSPMEPVADALRKQLHSGKTETNRVRALLTLHAIDALFPSDYVELTTHGDAAIRAWAIRLAPGERKIGTEKEKDRRELASHLANRARSETAPRVRLAIATILPELPAEKRWPVIEALAGHAEDANDRYLPSMIWFGLAPLTSGDPERAMKIAESTRLSLLSDSIRWYLARTESGREGILETLQRRIDQPVERTLHMLAWGMRDLDPVHAPAGWADLDARLRTDQRLTTVLDELGVQFGDAEVLRRVRASLTDRAASTETKERAIELLGRIGDTGCALELLSVLDDEELRSAAIPLLGRFDDERVASALIDRLESFDDDDRSAALIALSHQPLLAKALLDSVDAKRVDRNLITALHVRDMQNLKDSELTLRVSEGWTGIQSDASIKEKIGRLRTLYREAPVWAYERDNGAAIYSRICASCHKHNGKGGDLGPDLTGSWRNGLDYFLESIVDPNAVVGDTFRLHVITQKDDNVVSGILRSESDETITLANTNDTFRIPRNTIAEHDTSEFSMMPAGLLDTLSEREVIELLKFLVRKK